MNNNKFWQLVHAMQANGCSENLALMLANQVDKSHYTYADSAKIDQIASDMVAEHNELVEALENEEY